MEATPAKRAVADIGFTLIELMLVVAFSALLAAVAIPSYNSYVDRSQNSQGLTDILSIALAVKQWETSLGVFPNTLAEAGLDGRRDPWGNPYVYVNVVGNPGASRKDKNLHPINTDFDLYSKGKDGESVSALTAKPSRDDLIRASNGGFVGVAEDY